MRTPTEALKELRDRLTYFCAQLDGKYDPPWVTELIGIIDDTLSVTALQGRRRGVSEKHETIADIVVEMRGFKRYATSDSNDCRYVAYWLYQTFADRIEAAHKREATAEKSSAVDNGAKMREALEFLIKHKEWLRGFSLTMTLEDLEIIDRILGKAEAALAETVTPAAPSSAPHAAPRATPTLGSNT